MARPRKEGLDYFPLDVDIDQDDKIAIIEAKHGLTGFAIVIKLLMKIYKNGYYYDWTEKEQLLFSKRSGINMNTLNDIINDCLKWEVFDADMYSNLAILTSKGIQRRYLIATDRRNKVILEKKHMLLDYEEAELLNKNINVDINYNSNDINYNSNDINVDINYNSREVNANISTQSKVKKSKVKKSKEENSKTINKPPISPKGDREELQEIRFNEFWELYPKKQSKSPALKAWLKLKLDDELFQAIITALKEQINCDQWQRSNGQFIPNPLTWINQKRWEDEVMKNVKANTNNYNKDDVTAIDIFNSSAWND